jgi:hypothetical protein
MCSFSRLQYTAWRARSEFPPRARRAVVVVAALGRRAGVYRSTTTFAAFAVSRAPARPPFSPTRGVALCTAPSLLPVHLGILGLVALRAAASIV